MKYTKGYKYQLEEDYEIQTGIIPAEGISNRFLVLDIHGLLLIKNGYAWDGPSGPAIDTKNFMRGSLVHDALYQLMRIGLLDRVLWRYSVDRELVEICKEDGMSYLRRQWVYFGVKEFAEQAAMPRTNRTVFEAP